MYSRFLLIMLFLAPSISFAQDNNEESKSLSVQYSGDPSELKHKVVITVQDNSQFLFLVLEQNYDKTQKLSLQLKRLWRDAVGLHCNGKYKGHPRLVIAPIFGECIDPETRYRVVCSDIISGVEGKFSCGVGS